MDIAVLAEGVLNALLPYLQLSAESFAREAGSSACDKVGEILSALRKRWQGSTSAATLDRLEQDPSGSIDEAARALVDTLSNDPAFAEQLANLLQAGGPELNLRQHVRKTNDIVGVSIRVARSGSIEIQQTVGEAVNVIGANIDTFG